MDSDVTSTIRVTQVQAIGFGTPERTPTTETYIWHNLDHSLELDFNFV